MVKPNYSIKRVGSVVLVRHSGHWTLAKDIEYLAALNEQFVAMRPKKFVVFVDMRNWHVPDSVRHTTVKEDLRLDRRGQLAECWLCDDIPATDYILHFFKKLQLTVNRITDLEEAKAWVMAYTMNEEDKNKVEQWFSEAH